MGRQHDALIAKSKPSEARSSRPVSVCVSVDYGQYRERSATTNIYKQTGIWGSLS